MIKYYTYYSCGGYKDLYIGSDQDSSDASYFLPLLNIWKKNSDKPGNAEKIARAEAVQQVELITQSHSAGFPAECNRMFTHGGYSAIYRTLSDGRTCLCIRDIQDEAKDEEGRDIPFNFMFLADGEQSIEKLDGLALEYLSNAPEINASIADAISYDPILNGIKFDLSKLDALYHSENRGDVKLLHQADIVDYLKIGSRPEIDIALKEQGLDRRRVASAWDADGQPIAGNIRYLTVKDEQATEEEQEDKEPAERDAKAQESSDVTDSKDQPTAGDDKPLAPHDLPEEAAGPEDKADPEDEGKPGQTPEESVSSNAQKENETRDIPQTGCRVVKVPAAAPAPAASNKKIYIVAAICLIVGFILGALIF